ncbi:MAG: glycosyltransferase family 39 protein [Planctomycetes bacterium]|nr:glycosyltransferase family 39 protein [Planctomycetota bacterium]
MDAQGTESRGVGLTSAELPPSLPAWLPFLWRRVLFPGTRPAEEAFRGRGALLWLLLLPAVLLYPCLSFDLFEPDESRYAQIPREMLARGEWVVPYLQGEPYLDKPPLFYWLVMGSYRVCGVSPEAARLVPALALHLCVLLVYLLGRRRVGERAAFRGALVLGLAPGFLGMGRLLILDGLLTLWTTLALLAAFEALSGERLRWGWWLLSALACGLGVLTKGPVAGLLLVPPLLLHGWLAGGFCRAGLRALLIFAGVVAAVVLPWYVAVCLRMPEFARYFLWEQNVLRFVAPFDHPRGVWFYLPVVLVGLLPATLLLVPFVRFLLSGKEDSASRRCPELGFLLLGGGWCLLFFTLSGCKLPTYVLPAFPPLALALGYFVAHGSWRHSRWLAGVATTAFLLLLGFHHLLLPWYAHYRSPLQRSDVLVRYCADPNASVVCYPRPCNVVAYFLGRDDLHNYRSKEIEELRTLVRLQPRTVILCTHRHALDGLRELLPPEVRIVKTAHFGLGPIPGVPASLTARVRHFLGGTALGLSDLAVVEPKTQDQPVARAMRNGLAPR